MIVELLVLELTDGAQPPPQVPREVLTAFLIKKGEDHHASEVWYVSPDVRDASIIREDNPRITLINNNAVFGKFLPLPDDLFSVWIREASTVDSSTFNAFYQRRAAATLDLPNPESRKFFQSLDAELGRWAAARTPERPLLLLGDRGSGKTWQLIKFCQDQQTRHEEEPWLFPVALYLSLRGVNSYLQEGRVSSLGLYALLAQRYSWFEVKWNVTMLQALLECGRLIICLDGLDEFGPDAPDEGVGDHLARVVELLPRGSRFILTCRTTHFSSFAELAGLETWPGSSVAGTMRVLQILPFGALDLANYVDVVKASAPATSTTARLGDLVQSEGPIGPIIQALQRFAKEPAILSRLVAELADDPEKTNLELIRSGLEDSLISFNLEAERTDPVRVDADGNIQAFGTRERVAFLGELAWFMAERNLSSINLQRLPQRIALMFGVTSKALQRDIRSQTVFELDEPGVDNETEKMQSDESESSPVRFAFRLGASATNRKGQVAEGVDHGPTGRPDGQSVANAYFLAFHIRRRLGDQLAIPGVRPDDVMQYIGRVRLGDLTAAILQQQIDAGEVFGYDSVKLRTEIRALVRRLAAEGGYKVFNRSLRFLVANAVRMRILSEGEGADFDPWPPNIAAIVSSPKQIPDYELVLVPPYDGESRQPKFPATLVNKSNGNPFLIGLHEITNQHFHMFLQSQSGRDWTVERIRRSALEDGAHLRSPKADLTNEYHLYFWVEQQIGGNSVFAPSRWYLRHPVVYVSLYAAEAFCMWLNETSGALEANLPYRLPTAAEWRWAAQGGYENAKYPWDLVPYPVDLPDEPSRQSLGNSGLPIDEQDTVKWLRNYRSAAQDVLLNAGKRSSEVGLDEELSPHGVMGLIGNVKEWVGDRILESQNPEGKEGIAKWKGMVRGGTARLGPGSFLFDYYATLYPENTNPDVGFRIARSLTPDELQALSLRQSELAALKCD